MTAPLATTIQLAQLVPAPRNANQMEPARYDALRAAIEREGFLQPVLVRPSTGNEFEIIDGHHRVQAARDLGLSDVPALIVDSTTEGAARLAIAMNRLRGDLNLSVVAEVFAELSDAGIDPALLEATGFTKEEIDDLLEMANADAEDVLGGATTVPDPDPPAAGAFVLEVEFNAAADMARARKALKRAAGKGKPLGAGLLALLGEEV